MNWSDINWMAILPETIVFFVSVLLLIGEIFVGKKSIRRMFGVVTLVGLLATLASVVAIWDLEASEFFGMFSVDFTANVLKAILIIVTSLVVLGVLKSETNIGEGEFFSLILFSVLGTMFLASASDLIMLFIALELTVIPAYILTASRRTAKSSEAALKYFLLGVVASAILLYGMSILFGLTGETNFAAIGCRFEYVSG
ncbi:MAG: hypothetical protein HY779_06030 [Rubrobacteridae bacterium]|nr:hypothetical protein [Rubrobacteridae bacterium]